MADNPGHFKAGDDQRRGKNGGRPALPEEFKLRGPERLAAMENLAASPEHEHYFDALKWCLERQYGKPVNAVELGEDTVNGILALITGVKDE